MRVFPAEVGENRGAGGRGSLELGGQGSLEAGVRGSLEASGYHCISYTVHLLGIQFQFLE